MNLALAVALIARHGNVDSDEARLLRLKPTEANLKHAMSNVRAAVTEAERLIREHHGMSRWVPQYLERVTLLGIDKDGHKENFDDFVGEFIGERDGLWMISNGVHIYSRHPDQVQELA